MSKYAPLRYFLEAKSATTVALTFAEVEQVLGFKLPASHRYRAWWSNNGFNNVMTAEWLAAGYKTEQVDIKGRKLVFRRLEPRATRGSGFEEESAVVGIGVPAAKAQHPRRHPLFGALKDITWIAPGVDLTEPADPEMADYVDSKYGPDVGEQTS